MNRSQCLKIITAFYIDLILTYPFSQLATVEYSFIIPTYGVPFVLIAQAFKKNYFIKTLTEAPFEITHEQGDALTIRILHGANVKACQTQRPDGLKSDVIDYFPGTVVRMKHSLNQSPVHHGLHQVELIGVQILRDMV